MIEKLSVVAADIDGTLCLKGGKPGPVTREMLNRLHREGVRFGVASGRPLDRRIIGRAAEWDLDFEFDFVIGMNGGELYDKNVGEIERYFQLQADDVKRIVTFLAPLDLNVIVYVDGYDHIRALHLDDFLIDSRKRNNSYVEIGDVDFVSEFDTGKIEVHLKPDIYDEVMEIINAHEDPNWICVKTFEGPAHITIEFLDPNVEKGYGLRKYSERYNIPLSEFMAFGDMENDIPLLKEAGWGVCLINGSDATKDVAQAVTEYGVLEDGVGRYLQDHWYSKQA